jgi:hypothetical protein
MFATHAGFQTVLKPEYIYMIAEKTTKLVDTGGCTGYYKVGRTDNLQERIKDLQTGNPHQLDYVWAIQVNPSQIKIAENAAHAAVRDQYPSYQNGGKEWYLVPLQNQAMFMQQVLDGIQAHNVKILAKIL